VTKLKQPIYLPRPWRCGLPEAGDSKRKRINTYFVQTEY